MIEKKCITCKHYRLVTFTLEPEQSRPSCCVAKNIVTVKELGDPFMVRSCADYVESDRSE